MDLDPLVSNHYRRNYRWVSLLNLPVKISIGKVVFVDVIIDKNYIVIDESNPSIKLLDEIKITFHFPPVPISVSSKNANQTHNKAKIQPLYDDAALARIDAIVTLSMPIVTLS